LLVSRLDATLARLQLWDERVCLRFNHASRRPLLLGVLRIVSRLGDGVLWYALMLAMLLTSSEAFVPVVHMLATGLACTASYKLLKRGTLRPRPYQVLDSIAVGIAPLDNFSVPSGHTLHAVAFTLVATSYYPWLAVALIPFTVVTGIARVMLGLHYPSDVLAGAALGAALASLSLLVF
jgi:undecaprenyl-diphosphatase